jgi:hypothetical protein
LNHTSHICRVTRHYLGQGVTGGILQLLRRHVLLTRRRNTYVIQGLWTTRAESYTARSPLRLHGTASVAGGPLALTRFYHDVARRSLACLQPSLELNSLRLRLGTISRDSASSSGCGISPVHLAFTGVSVWADLWVFWVALATQTCVCVLFVCIIVRARAASPGPHRRPRSRVQV